jgi:hypothetical protein
MKRIDYILLGLQYGAAGFLLISGLYHGNSGAAALGGALVCTTVLYHVERIKRIQLQEILKKLPDDKIVARQAAKTASEFTQLNSYEKGVMEHGFIAGVEFIYKNLNAK